MALCDDLPASYVGNLAELPKRCRDAIQEDRKRWALATKIFREKSDMEIRTWLRSQYPDEYREDMRRRLIMIRQGRAKSAPSA